MKPYKRRNYFVDRRYQGKYILLTITLLLLYTLTLVALIFIPYIIDLATGGSINQQAEAARALLALNERVWPGIVAAMLLFSTLSVYVSHKVAGPVYRIKKGVLAFIAGDFDSRIQLRQRDDLKDLAECTNHLGDRLRTVLEALHDSQELLERTTTHNVSTDEAVLTALERNKQILATFRSS